MTTPALSRLLTRHVGILYTPTESLALRWRQQQQQQRGYAKKNKKKGGASAAGDSNVNITEDIARAFDEKKLQERMDGTITSLKESFKTLRVGRANPGIHIRVTVYIFSVIKGISRYYYLLMKSGPQN